MVGRSDHCHLVPVDRVAAKEVLHLLSNLEGQGGGSGRRKGGGGGRKGGRGGRKREGGGKEGFEVVSFTQSCD